MPLVNRSAPNAPCVLIVDDEVLSGLSVARSVTDDGCAVDGPHLSAKAALAAIAAKAPDVALLDVSLGAAGTSVAVADALAAAGIPFAFVTGYGPETAAVVAAHPGCLVIPKPVDRETVALLLAELLAAVPANPAAAPLTAKHA